MIRKATENDIKAIAEIYEDIHTEEEAGNLTIGWERGVYPTEKTAADSVAAAPGGRSRYYMPWLIPPA